MRFIPTSSARWKAKVKLSVWKKREEMSITCDLNAHTAQWHRQLTCCPRSWSYIFRYSLQPVRRLGKQIMDVRMLQRTRWHCVSEMNMILMQADWNIRNILCHDILERFQLDSVDTFALRICSITYIKVMKLITRLAVSHRL